MTIKQLIPLLPKVVKYNLKIIFAGKFIWFLLAAFAFFAYFMFQAAWNRAEINEGLIYNLLMFPCVLLVFYPAVFGIQNDEDNRILEAELMSRHTTFRIGGPADFFLVPENADEIKKIIAVCKEKNVPYFILGNGSNLLVSDKGYQ